YRVRLHATWRIPGIRPPPAPCVGMWPPHGPMRIYPTIVPPPAQAPTVPRIVIHVEAPCPGTWPPEPGPGTVIETGTVDHHSILHVRTQIARCITDIHDVRCVIVDVHITHIIDRTFRRDGPHLCGHLRAYLPRPIGCIAFIPHTLIAHMVTPVDP